MFCDCHAATQHGASMNEPQEFLVVRSKLLFMYDLIIFPLQYTTGKGNAQAVVVVP